MNNTTMTPVKLIADLPYSIIMDTDSYKLSHWLQYVEGTSRMMSYLEVRGGELDSSTLFGLQYIMHKYLSKAVTQESINCAEEFALKHGEPFNKAGWEHILEKYDGKLPVTIRAVPEGTVVPVGNALLTIECDDPKCFWVASWLETMLVRLWYPSTIAMASRASKQILLKYLEKTSDEDPQVAIMFKLHDFGARGVACLETARLGGSAHLLSFLGSDTISGIELANHYYYEEMAGFSIPASEHSTVSMWQREHEYDMFESFVDVYLTNRETPEGVPKLAACVSDTFNVFEAVEAWSTGKLKEKIKASGGTLVIRPDSGDPREILGKIFAILEKNLADEITTNSKGYKVLPYWIRVIQGDGITRKSMEGICEFLTDLEWSLDNYGFGSGGGLLQMVNRDTQKWAFKCCAAMVNGKWVDVRKNPITDQGKQSKGGRLDLIIENGEYKTIALPEWAAFHDDTVMQLAFRNGDIFADTTFAECRERMQVGL